mgnify:FL=1
MTFESFASSDTGRRRRNNEDAFLALPACGLFAVADGMGGHAAGEVASGMAIATVEKTLPEILEKEPEPAAAQAALVAAVQEANRLICEAAGSTTAHAGMGTTLTVLALLAHAHVYRIAHVGDSRAYLLRDGELTRLTRDQTWVQDRVDAGLLTPEQARTHPLAALLTGALGTHGDVDIETVAGDIRPDDLFLLCSDGLTTVLDDADLLRLLGAGLPPDAAAARLVDEANLRGGPDNITVLLIRAVDRAA